MSTVGQPPGGGPPAFSSRPAGGGPSRRRAWRLVWLPGLLGFLGVASLAAPTVVTAHGLSPVYQSPLPLAVYLAGAATTVALSFAFVLARDMRANPSAAPRIVAVPVSVRLGLRAVGLLGWAWILAQGIAGGSSSGEVATLFLWVYGWVGLAMLSALIGPVWQWLDPFATLHDAGAWLLTRLGVRGWAPADLPPALRTWPAVIGLAAAIWLELVEGGGAATLTVVLAGYTLFTLAMMAQFGRDTWRAQGETFSVWFGLLNRLAPYGPVPAWALVGRPGAEAVADRNPATRVPGAPRGFRDLAAADSEVGGPDAAPWQEFHPNAVAPPGMESDTARPDLAPAAPAGGHVVRRPFASGLLEARWTRPEIILVALGTASIIFDGLSQTAPWASVFGNPGIGVETVLLAGFLGIVAAAALGVAKAVAPGAIGSGLLPIAVGYLLAHYLTYLLVDGQRILIAISDPLQQGWDVFGTAFHEPTADWLPAGLVWTLQLGAVVGGHMLGAWAGHVTASRDADTAAAPARPADGEQGRAPRDLRHRRLRGLGAVRRRSVRAREIPLALVMVGLTTLTLWSLGQAIVLEPDEDPAPRGSSSVTRLG